VVKLLLSVKLAEVSLKDGKKMTGVTVPEVANPILQVKITQDGTMTVIGGRITVQIGMNNARRLGIETESVKSVDFPHGPITPFTVKHLTYITSFRSKSTKNLKKRIGLKI
jgi:hypothetical protein